MGISGHFSTDWENEKKIGISRGGLTGPIHPVWGHVLVSFE